MLKRIIAIWIMLLSVTAIADDKIVNVVVSDHPPFEYIGENGNITGIDVDIITEVFKRAGYKVEFTLLPWMRALDLVTKGEVDAMASIVYSPEHNKMLMLSNSIAYSQNFFFKKKSLKVNPKNFDDLKSYSIGTLINYPYGKKFDQAKFPDIEVMASTSPIMDNLKKLVAGRVDLIVCELLSCNYFINKYPDRFVDIDYIESPPVNDIMPYYLGFSRKNHIRSAMLLKIFNDELKKATMDGTTAEILLKYKKKHLYEK
jgi:polar amino acid transport system substrate-binding protein